MVEQPFAFLWQNGDVLDDGCCQFYPTAERADAEIAYSSGWKTPVFRVADGLAGSSGAGQFRVFDGLEAHRPAERLDVSPKRAAEIVSYMEAEDTAKRPLRPSGSVAHG